MKVSELLEAKQLTRAEKDAKRAASKQQKKEEWIKQHYGDDDFAIVEIPVLISGKWEKRDFIIDNTHDQHQKVSDLKLIDMGQIELDPRQREEYEGAAKYSIYNGRDKYDTYSVPKYLHNLPSRAKHNDKRNPEDLRRKSYTA